jgi:ribosomal protein L37AE/L43A
MSKTQQTCVLEHALSSIRAELADMDIANPENNETFDAAIDNLFVYGFSSGALADVYRVVQATDEVHFCASCKGLTDEARQGPRGWTCPACDKAAAEDEAMERYVSTFAWRN